MSNQKELTKLADQLSVGAVTALLAIANDLLTCEKSGGAWSHQPGTLLEQTEPGASTYHSTGYEHTILVRRPK